MSARFEGDGEGLFMLDTGAAQASVISVSHPLPLPDDLDIGRLAYKVRTKIIRILRKRGLLYSQNLLNLESLTIEEPHSDAEVA